jgi:hypothetical protein
MAKFDPDAYLAAKPAFDPDAYLAVGNPKKGGRGSFDQNLAGSILSGAGDIGATLLSPIDALARAANNGKPIRVGGYDIVGQDRRAGIEDALKSTGVNTDATEFKVGRVATQVAGTAGAGGVVAKGLTAAAPMVARAAPAVANALTKFAPAVESGGLVLGANAPTNLAANLALRAGGGAVSGGLSAGMVNPEDAAMGAAIGGALPVGVKAAGAAGKLLNQGVSGLTKHALGLSTGTGGESVATAYRAGKQGGTSFLDNMRGNVPMTDVLDSAKQALGQMRLDRSAQYKSGMAGVSADKTVIDFMPIDKAVTSLQSMGNYKGQVINKNSSGVVDEISGLVNQWKSLDPAEFHTPEGLDALKQAISDIRDTTQFGTAARKAADTAYNAVKGEIVSQAPTYSKVMKDYSQASELLSEIERTFSANPKASIDTSMRKLQSLMRNNVNTNFGNRLGLAKTLEQNGAEILPAIAGQAMSSWTPRGLQAATSGGALFAAVPTGGASLAAIPFTSPRLAGEAAYGLGRAVRGVGNAGTAAQSRLMQLLNQNGGQIGMEQFAPFIATTPVLAANQR